MTSTTPRETGRAIALAAIVVLSVVALSTAFTGSTVGQDRSFATESELYNATVVWHGQEIAVGGLAADEAYDLHTVADGFRTQYSTDAGGTLHVDTEEVGPGTYYLEGPGTAGDADDATFTVVEQSLAADFDGDVAPGNTVDLELSSNRSSYAVEVDAGGDLSGAELADILPGTPTQTGDGSVVLADADGTHAADFSGIDEGTYTFTVNVTDSTAETSATVDVSEEIVTRSFGSESYETRQGGVANITVALNHTDTAALQIGAFDPDADRYYEVGLTIDTSAVDRDVVGLPFNLYAAGGGGLPDRLVDELGYLPQMAVSSPELWDAGVVEWEYRQMGSVPELDDPGAPVEANETYLDGDGGFLPAGTYRLALGDAWETPIETTFDEDHGIPIVDAEIASVEDSATLTVDPAEPPAAPTAAVLPATADPVADYEDSNVSTLGAGVTTLEPGGAVAVETQDGTVLDGDPLLVSLEDVGLGGSIPVLWFAHALATAEEGPPAAEATQEGATGWATFDETLHLTGSSIEVSLEQENPSPFRDDVLATTNVTRYAGTETEPGLDSGPVTVTPADNWEDRQQLVLHAPILDRIGLPADGPDAVAPSWDDVTEHFAGHLTAQINYSTLEGLAAGTPATLTVDMSDLATDLGLPAEAGRLETEVVFEEANVTLEDAFELPNSESATITAETNLAAGHELEATAESTDWIRVDGTEVDEDGAVSFSFDLSAAEPGQAFDLEVTGPLGTGDLIAGLAIDEDPGAPASFDVDATAPDTVAPGDGATLDVTLTNDGDQDGETNYTVTVDDAVVEDDLLALDGGEELAMTYDLPTDEAGEVEWEVESDDDTVVGTLTVESASSADDGDDGQPGFGLAVALVALLATAAIARRRA